MILPPAVAELDAIGEYIAAASPTGAAKVVTRLLAAIGSLERLPHRHKVHESRRSDGLSVRVLVSFPYLIYYRIDDANLTVRILRVLHGARRQPKRFR